MKKRIRPHSLYLVLSGEYLPAGRGHLTAARSAIEGGVDVIQLREKDMPRGELVGLGAEMAAMCSAAGVIFIVNDDPVLAVECRADGVHVGQEDIRRMPVREIRKIVGNDRLIGLSTHSPGEYLEASKEDLDYIAYGPVFPTRTKHYYVGIENVGGIASSAEKPTVFIGGIDTDNVTELVSRGANIAAAIRSIIGSDDIAATVRMFKKKLGAHEGAPESILIRMNGKGREAKSGSSVEDIVVSEQLRKEHVVVEYNGEILDPRAWALCRLKTGDTLEIVSFVGGG